MLTSMLMLTLMLMLMMRTPDPLRVIFSGFPWGKRPTPQNPPYAMYSGPGTGFDELTGPSRAPNLTAIMNIYEVTCRSEGPSLVTLASPPSHGWGSTPTPPHHVPSLGGTSRRWEPGGQGSSPSQGTNIPYDRTKGEKHSPALRGCYPLNTAESRDSWAPLSG